MKKNMFAGLGLFSIIIGIFGFKMPSTPNVNGTIVLSGFIGTAKDGKILLLNQEFDAKKPVFYFFQPVKMPTNIGRKLVNAKVTIAEKYIFIQNGNGENIVFYLDKSELSNAGIKADVEVSIYGLGNGVADAIQYSQSIKSLVNHPELAKIGITKGVGIDIVVDFPPVKCACENTGSGASCSSGGTGSTSCGASSGGEACNVTCGSGYYACCN